MPDLTDINAPNSISAGSSPQITLGELTALPQIHTRSGGTTRWRRRRTAHGYKAVGYPKFRPSVTPMHLLITPRRRPATVT